MINEKAVLDKVNALLKNGDEAYFYYGTLFVTTSDEVAGHVLSMLQHMFDFAVLDSREGDEFVYDFA